MHYKAFNQADIKFFPLLGLLDNDGEPLTEKEAYKVPRSSGWKSVPVWSAEQIDLMEMTGQLDTGYAVLTDGLMVVDVDARSGGIESLARLIEVVPELEDAGLQVATGSGGGSRHFYFLAPEGVALAAKIQGYDGIDVKSGRGSFVVGPGSMHVSGNKYTIIEGNPDDIDDAPQALIDLIKKPEYHRVSYDGGTMDVSKQEIADMMTHIKNDDLDYEEWVRVGMAIHHSLNGDGFDLWDKWSQSSSKYDDRSMSLKWHSFGKSAMPVTVGTLIHYAEQGGWKQPVTFEAEDMIEAPANSNPLDTSLVDLLRPPGFAGELCAWVNDQCMYPREHLAVMVTLVALGNVCGLRYTDDLDGVTSNLFGFGVADSGSGKESTYGAFNEIMRKSGLVAAMHGAQKSEQEVIRNFIRHQAAFYSIDEFGLQLQKVINAGQRGGATYLEGLIAIMMSAYSKAGSFLPVSGDVKEDMKEALRKEISQHTKAIENNEDPTGQRASKMAVAMRMLAQVDNGIERPFLSVMGMTTPSTFDGIVTPDQATSGFIGRAIIVRELDPNPVRKYPFKKRPMPSNMEMQLQALAFGGECNPDQDRIESYDDRIAVETTDEAKDALADVYQSFWEMAEQQKEATGLTPIPRRGYEMVAKVSLILSAPGGIRTLEHVQWAYALVKKDIDEKLRLVVSNDVTYGTDRVLMSKITNIISEDHGETLGVIRNKLRSYKPDDVSKALEILATKGLAEKRVTKSKSNGRTSERWFFTG